MDLYIDTSVNPLIKLLLKKGEIVVLERSFEAKFLQAEKLLLSIEELLKEADSGLESLTKIFVAQKGDSFSALRIGVITANSLAYALCIPINDKLNTPQEFGIVEPIYNRDPNITIAKKLEI